MALGEDGESTSSGIHDILCRIALHQRGDLARRTDVAAGESSWRRPGVQPGVSSVPVPKHGDGNEMAKRADPPEMKHPFQDAKRDITIHSPRERIQIQSGHQEMGEQSATMNLRFHQLAAEYEVSLGKGPGQPVPT